MQLVGAKYRRPAVETGEVIPSPTRGERGEVLDKPRIGLFIGFQPGAAEPHQGVRPGAGDRIADRIEKAEFGRDCGYLTNGIFLEERVGRGDFTLLAPMVRCVAKDVEPPIDAALPAFIPKMNFLAAREVHLGMAPQTFENPGSRRLLCANSQEIDHDAALVKRE